MTSSDEDFVYQGKTHAKTLRLPLGNPCEDEPETPEERERRIAAQIARHAAWVKAHHERRGA